MINNFYNFVKTIKELSLNHHLVNETGEGDIYTFLNSGEHKYPCIFLTVNNINHSNEFFTINGTLFYVDKMTDDESNKTEIQSNALTILSQIVNKISDNNPIWTFNANSYTPFTEKFSDLCAGMYLTFAVTLPNEIVCEDSDYEIKTITISKNGLYDVIGYDKAYIVVQPTWGQITGDIEDQTDLVDLIDSKVDSKTTEWGTIEGNIQSQTDLIELLNSQKAEWGNIDGNIQNQTDLINLINSKPDNFVYLNYFDNQIGRKLMDAYESGKYIALHTGLGIEFMAVLQTVEAQRGIKTFSFISTTDKIADVDYITYIYNIVVDLSDYSVTRFVTPIKFKTINNASILTSQTGGENISLQPPLVSGVNIKTINNQSILGSGNIEIEGGTKSRKKVVVSRAIPLGCFKEGFNIEQVWGNRYLVQKNIAFKNLNEEMVRWADATLSELGLYYTFDLRPIGGNRDYFIYDLHIHNWLQNKFIYTVPEVNTFTDLFDNFMEVTQQIIEEGEYSDNTQPVDSNTNIKQTASAYASIVSGEIVITKDLDFKKLPTTNSALYPTNLIAVEGLGMLNKHFLSCEVNPRRIKVWVKKKPRNKNASSYFYKKKRFVKLDYLNCYVAHLKKIYTRRVYKYAWLWRNGRKVASNAYYAVVGVAFNGGDTFMAGVNIL